MHELLQDHLPLVYFCFPLVKSTNVLYLRKFNSRLARPWQNIAGIVMQTDNKEIAKRNKSLNRRINLI